MIHVIQNLRYVILQREDKLIDLGFEHVADDLYTLDIEAVSFNVDTVVKLISLSRQYPQFLTHELLNNGLLRLHFKLDTPI